MQDFEEIYREYNGHILKVARKYSENIYDAEDIAQETFIALYDDMQKRRSEASEDYDNIKSWLSVVAKNKALNLLRGKDRVILQEELTDSVNSQQVAADSAEDVYVRREGSEEKKEFCRNILKAIRDDSDLQYKAIFDSCYSGLTSAKIAERTGTNSACIDSRIYRARQKLKKRYLEDYNKLRYV